VFPVKQNQYIAPPSLDNKNNMRERTTRLLDVLEREGVLRETDGNIRFSDDFRETFAAYADRTGTADGSPIHSYEGVLEESRVSKPAVAGYVNSLQDFGVDVELGGRELVIAGLALARVDEDLSGGSSEDPFLTLDGKELVDFLEGNAYGLVLVVKQDCDPCESIREKLNTLLHGDIIPETLPLIEISGPENRDLLMEEYDVVGAPTLLFCKGGRVEMRLIGDKHINQLKSDISKVYPNL